MRVVLICNECGLNTLACECFDVEEPHPDYTPDYLSEEETSGIST